MGNVKRESLVLWKGANISLLIVLSLFGTSFSASSIPDYLPRIGDAMSLIFDDKYSDGFAILDSISLANRNDPSAKVFRVIGECSRMHDNENEELAPKLFAKIETLLVVCEGNFGIEPRDSWESYVMGNLVGQKLLLGYVSGEQGIISSYNDMRRAKALWENAASDSLIAEEAFVGLGNLCYWLSSKAGVLRSLGIVGDNRKRGIEMLERAAKHSRIGRASALHSLIFARLDAEDTTGAIAALSTLEKLYPSARTTNWAKLFLSMSMKHYDEVPAITNVLLEHYIVEKSQFNIVQLLLAESYAQMKLSKREICCALLDSAKTAGNKEVNMKLSKRGLSEMRDEIESFCAARVKTER